MSGKMLPLYALNVLLGQDMSIVVNTNIASMRAQRSLASSGKDLQQAMERLSSGKRINSAADDAAGFAIAERMTSQVRGLSMAAKNASDARGLLKVVENASNDVTDMLQRVRELAVQAASGTNSSSDIKNLQGEADALMTEITRVSSDTTYNGKKRIGADAGTINIQVGYNDGDQIALKTYSVSSASLLLETAALLAANKVLPELLLLILQLPVVTRLHKQQRVTRLLLR